MFNLANHNKCILTELHNNECGKPDDLFFDDIFNRLGLKNYDWWGGFGHTIFMTTVWLIAMYKIVNRRKLKLDL
jgi:hypothetical protein